MSAELKQKLIQKAKDKHKDIYPCREIDNLEDSFTIHNNELIFWFNTRDLSTKIMSEPIS